MPSGHRSGISRSVTTPRIGVGRPRGDPPPSRRDPAGLRVGSSPLPISGPPALRGPFATPATAGRAGRGCRYAHRAARIPDLPAAGPNIVCNEQLAGPTPPTGRTVAGPASSNIQRGRGPRTATCGPVHASTGDDLFHGQHKQLVAPSSKSRETHSASSSVASTPSPRSGDRAALEVSAGTSGGCGIHPRRFEIDNRRVAGVEVDLNEFRPRDTAGGIDGDRQTLPTSKICQQTFECHFGEQSWTGEPSNRLAGPSAAATPTANLQVTIR